MNKKRIGELYDLPIVTGDLNMVNNHELLLEMNDDNTPRALKRRVNGDLFKTILGEGSGGNTNPGYSLTKQTVTLFNDTIETQESNGVYQGVVENIDFAIVAGENYTVVFDGTSYDIKAVQGPFSVEEGQVQVSMGEINGNMPSFETYPFYIMYYAINGEQTLLLLSETEGSHTVEIKHEEETVTTTPEFKDAVDSVTGYSIDKGNETLYDGTVETGDPNGDVFFGVITPTITLVEGDTYKVTFNGVEYNCECFDNNGDLSIGTPFDIGEDRFDFDWSTYPFNIDTYPAGGGQYETSLITNQELPCTLKIEHLTTSTKTTPEFVSMIQGIAGSGSTSGCQIIYPDSISWVDTLYSQYNKEPEAGNIYFIPYIDTTDRTYLFPVYINVLTNDDNLFSGSATIIGTPVIVNNGTLIILDFGGVISPSSTTTSGLEIIYSDNTYRLSYKAGRPVG